MNAACLRQCGSASIPGQAEKAIEEQEGNVEQGVHAVENISGMSEQVNRASVEQKRASQEIAHNMEYVTDQFSTMFGQIEELQQHSNQIVESIRTIDSTTGQILQSAIDISGEGVQDLVQQSNILQKLISIFKVA